MFEWYQKKINEVIQVAHSSRHRILEAHFVLAKQVLNESTEGAEMRQQPTGNALHALLSLSLEQSIKDNNDHMTTTLAQALKSLEQTQLENTNVVQLPLESPDRVVKKTQLM